MRQPVARGNCGDVGCCCQATPAVCAQRLSQLVSQMVFDRLRVTFLLSFFLRSFLRDTHSLMAEKDHH